MSEDDLDKLESLKGIPNTIDSHGQVNSINVIWDELECFLKDDDCFKIETIEESAILIKALKDTAFSNPLIMSRVLGRILPFNCELNLKITTSESNGLNGEFIKYDFFINSQKGNVYKGIITVVR